MTWQTIPYFGIERGQFLPWSTAGSRVNGLTHGGVKLSGHSGHLAQFGHNNMTLYTCILRHCSIGHVTGQWCTVIDLTLCTLVCVLLHFVELHLLHNASPCIYLCTFE